MKKIDVESGVRIYSSTKDDIIQAMDLIGQEVYMSDGDFENYYEYRLIGVRFVEDDPFAFVGSDHNIYKYFILAKDARFKEEEKKLRPFKDAEEFFEETGLALGKTMRYRRKDDIDRDCVVIINGYTSDGHILLGAVYYKVKYLGDYFEYYDSDNSEWKPFGVEE